MPMEVSRCSARTPGQASAETLSECKQMVTGNFFFGGWFLESESLFDAHGGSANESIQSNLHNHGISKVEN